MQLDDAGLAGRISHGGEVPGWFTYPEVIETLRAVYPPPREQGVTLFFTGLSGSGKSTLAKIMYGKFIEEGRRPVTLLDGDIVRRHLSSELGFSKPHRDLNVRRIGFVASEITKNRGVAICAPIAPYAATRRDVREMIEAHGAMIEIHVSTPLEVCEARDRKGLYVKARKGVIPEFTGISDPYEEPENPEIRIDTTRPSPRCRPRRRSISICSRRDTSTRGPEACAAGAQGAAGSTVPRSGAGSAPGAGSAREPPGVVDRRIVVETGEPAQKREIDLAIGPLRCLPMMISALPLSLLSSSYTSSR